MGAPEPVHRRVQIVPRREKILSRGHERLIGYQSGKRPRGLGSSGRRVKYFLLRARDHPPVVVVVAPRQSGCCPTHQRPSGGTPISCARSSSD